MRSASWGSAHASKHVYRPEIDGLRALAVLTVLVNHLNSAWLPGGYLGVDLFFVISGYVVTSSLIGRPSTGWTSFLIEFYRRRFRRLLPALILMVLVVAVMFAAIVHPGEDIMVSALRTGIASLFGVSNLYLQRQGSNYFASDNHYNPFLHTWSLGVEEQFYFVWPWLLLFCGIGSVRRDLALQRLRWVCIALCAGSLVLLLVALVNGAEAASFYGMPTRFWEMAAGALAWLVWQSPRPTTGLSPRDGRGPRWLPAAALAGLLAAMVMPESWRVVATLICVGVAAVLLVHLDGNHGLGRWLTRPLPQAIGLRSYSLYLWHWPVIVLARWSVGLTPFSLVPIVLLIALLAQLSYQFECRWRHPQPRAKSAGDQRLRGELLTYPLMGFGAAATIILLIGSGRGLLFLGDRSRLAIDLGFSRRIPGTSVDTVHCFRDPTTPIEDQQDQASCRVVRNTGRPTLFFEGDSHTEMLIPVGRHLLKSGSFNVAFFARGGCPIPWFEPWAHGTDQRQRYALCKPHSHRQLHQRLQQIKPGDQLVLVLNLPGYLLDSNSTRQDQALEAYGQAAAGLARELQRRKAGLLLFAPLPFFPGRSALALPPSLCHSEWFRPAPWSNPTCKPVQRSRAVLRRELQPVAALLSRLGRDHPNVRVFDPFPVLCWRGPLCSTHDGEELLFSDSNHLSRAGAKRLENPLLKFLLEQQQPPEQQQPAEQQQLAEQESEAST